MTSKPKDTRPTIATQQTAMRQAFLDAEVSSKTSPGLLKRVARSATSRAGKIARKRLWAVQRGKRK